MNPTNPSIIILMTFCVILFLSACQDKAKSLPAVQIPKAKQSAPVSKYEYELIASQIAVFSFISGNAKKTLKAKDLIMKIEFLKKYFDSGSNVAGIRIYPAFEEDNLVLIFCLGNLLEKVEHKYRKVQFKNYDTLDPFDDGHIITDDSARVLITNFYDNILIYNKHQNTIPARFSRYYDMEELDKLFVQNSTCGTKAKFNFGYIGTETEALIHNRIMHPRRANYYDSSELMGSTIQLCVVTDALEPCLDETTTYNPDNPSYEKLGLEVGHPCPPLCGQLHE